ncbi:VOC family protein [Microvirga makkahensis]|uniref:Glyoxalase n=1 Tax=Microvirga makkahensis TaxID=1128670 RepID=A0A7X3MS72_9HYPH|nr:VOC family protein [Microvirga makkahensis]MXQ12266.1 glyoxalase [Microvirga makkahensis]
MSGTLAATVVSMRTFVPAKDFRASQDFYRELGFEIRPITSDLADVRLKEFSFILQNFYVEDWASNFMMYLHVSDVDAWWHRIDAAEFPTRYGVRRPRPPRLEPWGAKVAHIFDPSGVLWHLAEHAPAECGTG